MVPPYTNQANVILDPNLTDEERYQRLLEMEQGTTTNPLVTEAAEFGQIPMTDPELVSSMPPDESLEYGSDLPEGPTAAAAAPIAGAGGAGSGPAPAPAPMPISAGPGVAEVDELPMATGEAGTAPEPGPMSGGGAERMPLGQAMGMAPQPQPQGPSLQDLLALGRSPSRAIRTGPAGFQPQGRVTQENVIPPMQEFGQPISVPIVPLEPEQYFTTQLGLEGQQLVDALEAAKTPVGYKLPDGSSVVIQNNKVQRTTFDPSAPDARRVVDVGLETSLGNVVNTIANQAGISDQDAFQRMASPDGLVVQDPEAGLVLYRAVQGPSGPEIKASFTQQVDYTDRIQQKAQEFVEAQRQNLVQQTEIQKIERGAGEKQQEAIAGLTGNYYEKLKEQRQKINEAAEKLKNTEIDPQRYMKNETFGQALSRVMYMWAMGMAGGPAAFQYAVDDMDRLIQRDIEAQLQNAQDQKEYLQMLKEELPLIQNEFQSREGQIKAVHASRLAKTKQALRQARRTAAEMQGVPYMEEEDYALQQAIAELELRQSEALREAAMADAQQVRTTEKFDTGVRVVGGGDPLDRIKKAADVLRTLNEAQQAQISGTEIPGKNVLTDPDTGELRVAASPEQAKTAAEVRTYANAGKQGAQLMANAASDYAAGKISKAEYNQAITRGQMQVSMSALRLMSPEAVTESGLKAFQSATPAQRSQWLRNLPGGNAVAEFVSPGSNPQNLAGPTIEMFNELEQAKTPKTFSLEEAQALQRAGAVKF